jgi:hypothetical protein
MTLLPMLIPPSLDEQLARGLTLVPSGSRRGLLDYVRYGVPTGAFLRSLLENNLALACRRADAINAVHLCAYVTFLDDYVPAEAWGSPAAVEAWIDRGQRLRRWARQAEGEEG